MLVSEVVRDTTGLERCLTLIWEDMIDNEETVAGLDITWSQSNSPDHGALLSICTQIGCVLVRLDGRFVQVLEPFLDNKNITFVGVHIKEDVNRSIRKGLPLEIRNAVDVDELAANVLNQPCLRGLGLGILATKVPSRPNTSRSSTMARDRFTEPGSLKMNEIRSLTTDAYTAYKLAKILLRSLDNL